MPEALFDATGEAKPKRSREARRRERQAEAIQHGQHPLAVTLRIDLPLLVATPTRTCGDCRHRKPGAYPKCMWRPGDSGTYPRISHGPGTDCRKSWPACRDFQPKGGAR